jgi:hypothetical protein
MTSYNFTETASAVIKEFLKANSARINGIPKASGNLHNIFNWSVFQKPVYVSTSCYRQAAI